MTRTLKLVCGAASVDLINLSGIILQRQVDGPTLSEDNIAGEDRAVTEPYRLNLIGTSSDDAATKIQALMNMLRNIPRFRQRKSYTPVYLQEQITGETNPRYAQVFACYQLDHPISFRTPLELDHVIENFGFTLTREHPWSSVIPGTQPANPLTLAPNDGPASPTTVHVGNFCDDVAITHLYNYDVSVTTFSANFFNSNTISLWVVSGSTPAAGDIIYIGSTTAPWHHAVLNLKTAGVFNSDVQLEIWTGAAWVALTQGTQYSIYPSGAAGAASGIFNAIGDWVININPPTGWAANAINGITAYWIRLRLNAVTSWTTSPVTSDTQVPYFLKSNWVEIPAAASAGDAPPIGIIRLSAPLGAGTTPCFAATSLILMGARDRGLTKFVSDLNVGNYGNPADWAVTYGTDSSSAADVNAPRGKQCAVSFATNATSVVRASLTGTGMLAYWYGAFRVLLACQQIGGAANDTRVKLRICVGTSADSDPKMDTKAVKLQTHDAGYEVVDLGLIKLPFGEIAAADSLAADLIFQVMAERLTGTSTMKIASLILLPVDIWYCQLEDPKTNTSLGSSALRGNSILDLDGGVMAWRCTKFIKVGGNLIPAENWLAKGRALNVEPATKTRVYFLMMQFPATWGTGPMLLTTGMMLAVQVYSKNLFNVLRGAA